MKQMKSCWPAYLLPLLSWAQEFERCWMRLARVKTKVIEVLQRDGAIERLGEDRVYGNVYQSMADKTQDAPEA